MRCTLVGMVNSERLSSRAAAEYVGVEPATWRAYVAREQAPGCDGVDETFGRKYWLVSTLDEWMASRPVAGTQAK